MKFLTSSILLLMLLQCSSIAETKGQVPSEKITDVEYANEDGISLQLDLYLIESAKPAPLIIYIHGGAWRGGNKDQVSITGMLERGYAIASVEYRLTPVAPFPANLHDIKAAIRFLRANADNYGIDPDKFIISGDSAGGHLAALAGVSNQNLALEGKEGNHLGTSSDIQAIVDFYGASNLTTILKQSTPHGLDVRVPALELLLGGHPDEVPEIARLCSPVFHVDPADPPLLLLHGDQDPQMPINQAHELHGVYKENQLTVEFIVVHNSGHGGSGFYTNEMLDKVDAFLKHNL